MTGILTFETKHGTIAVEVDETVARAVGGVAETPAYTRKGSQTMTAKGVGDVVAKAPKSFDEAMATLKAYAGSLEDLIMGLDLTPKEVSVEIGLKMSGSAGFIIAKAGAETEMKVSLTWEPKGRARM